MHRNASSRRATLAAPPAPQPATIPQQRRPTPTAAPRLAMAIPWLSNRLHAVRQPLHTSAPPSPPISSRELILLIGLLLFTTFLAWFHLTAQPLWMDETYGLFFAQQPLSTMFHTLWATEPHLPIYFLLMRLWLPLAGHSSLAVRWFPSACFILTTPIVFRLARSLSGQRASWLGAIFWSLQPDAFWHSQEARMYSLIVLEITTALLLLLWAIRSHHLRYWILFASTETLALYTHYAATLSGPLVALLVLIGTRGRQRLIGLATLAFCLVSFLPWLWLIRHIHPPQGPPTAYLNALTPNSYITQLAQLILGYGAPLVPHAIQIATALAFTIILTFTILFSPAPLTLTAILVAIPFAIPIVIPLLHFLFDERYLMPFAGLIAVSWASIASLLSQRIPILAVLFTTAVTTASVLGLSLILSPQFHHWYNYAPAIAYIRAHESPGQLYIDNSVTDPSALYYYREIDHGSLPVITLPATHPGSVPQTKREATHLSQRYTGAWLPLDAAGDWDGDRVAERALNATLIPDGNFQFGNVSVLFYLTARGLSAQRPMHAVFANSIELTSFGLLHHGSTWYVAFHWVDLRPLYQNETVFVHVQQPSGALIATGDAPPDSGQKPTTSWHPGESIYDLHHLTIPTTSSHLQLVIGWYNLTTGQRLPISTPNTTSTDTLSLGPLTSMP